MHLLIIIDNISQNYRWYNTFNTIKKWLIYWFNDMLLNNKLTSLSIGKTYPEPVLIKLYNDGLTIQNIINTFESIIIKKSETYNCINIKHICDFINNKTKPTNKTDDIIKYNNIIIKNTIVYNDIWVFCSIIDASLNDTNVKYINESFINSPIVNIINISNKFIFKNFKKIKENILKHSDNIQLYQQLNTVISFNIPTNNFNEKDLSINNILNKLYEIEFTVYKKAHWSEQPITDELSNIYFNYVDNISKNNQVIFQDLNEKCNNFIKSCINWTKMSIIEKLNNINFNIPNPKINNDLIMDYVFEIIKFYNTIYPKMLNHHISKSNNKYSFDFKKINQLDFTNFAVKTFINDDSTYYLYSNTTLTNWKQEYENLNPFGLFINYTTANIAYKGIYNNSIFSNYPNTAITSVSNNWISLFDYYQLVSADIDINIKTSFNINEYEFIDNLHGNSNIMLPIFINKEHWKLVKKYWSYHQSFINQGFEFDYNKKMDNVYFLVLLKNINNIVNFNNNQNTIRLFFYILRTCIQICIDNKYSYNNKVDYNKYFTILIETKNYHSFHKNFMDYLFRLIQVIITGNISETELNNDMTMTFNTFLIHLIKCDYTSEQINEIKNMDLDAKNKEFQEIITKYNLIMLCYSELLKDLTFFNNFIKYIYSIKKFNQLIKYLDSLNGCLPTDEYDLSYSIIETWLTGELSKISGKKVIDELDIINKTNLFN